MIRERNDFDTCSLECSHSLLPLWRHPALISAGTGLAVFIENVGARNVATDANIRKAYESLTHQEGKALDTYKGSILKLPFLHLSPIHHALAPQDQGWQPVEEIC